jgi:hypothetical protein
MQPAAFSASKLPLLLRAVVDPEGKGEISAEDAATIKRIERNLARIAETDGFTQERQHGRHRLGVP